MFTKVLKKLLCTLTAIIVTGSVMLLSGCSTKEEQLNVYVAAGLKKPMEKVITAFQEETGVKVTPNYGPSGGLYTQIKEGQPCDLYFSADWLYIDKIEDDGNLIAAQKFLQDHMVLIVSETGKTKVKTVQDLNKPGVTVGICDPNAPVGVYAETALKNMDLWDQLNQTGNLKARPSTVNQLAIMVQKDELDAGLIFSSVAKGFGVEHVQTIPQEYTGEIIFGAATIKGGNEMLAQKFLDCANENIDEFIQAGWQAYQE
ncbi:molybdate ABC transporter substrate-binding protein [Desulfoscipio gibsoniae]|uniref:Molybdenum ABC transporter, periplasmic molybdate-binding protein n=1 Tax=Desulfoscipio gibsoniae DSM 7213 TaxID=767817 RepID=R4KKQ3_9FIRM|nr:molybdate ABC transporter substrate-binding protein [Desulfoscipio gibsoniae]AGL01090.1 molybdenum ABC transporter, periplasmic molybdate-binding protein [Desulfoscipio gibsoniae DSM 7213]